MLLLDTPWGDFPTWIQAVIAIPTLIIACITLLQEKKIKQLTDIVLELQNQTKELAKQSEIMSLRYELDKTASLRERMSYFQKGFYNKTYTETIQLSLKNEGTDAATVSISKALEAVNVLAEKLIELVTRKLLEKFGAGEHKPGSGSACAFQGLLSAQLLLTVIDLTDQPNRREKYKDNLDELLRIREDIQSRLYPTMERLFQEDSDLFDKVIGLRRERDGIDRSKDWLLYRKKTAAADDALKTATDLPISIAQNCYDLGKHAGIVFDHGFKSARGDSGVALQCAISGMASCFSVIELNLIKLPADAWMARVRKQKAILKTQHAELSAMGVERLAILEKEADENWQLQETFEMYRQGKLGQTIRTDEGMENLVRDFQNKLWIYRDKIWKKHKIKDAMMVLNARDIVQKVMGYTFRQSESLGMLTIGSELFEVAGMIDKNQGLISVSTQFPEEVTNFTIAHELAHVILHEHAVLHRDRPIDGSSSIPKDPLEQQADKFAAYFLMPASAVNAAFYEIFKVKKLYINENTVLALRGENLYEFKIRCKGKRGFATVIAQAEYYGGKNFNSLAKIFKGSAGAMAIRLMELDLVEF